jgi:hypothetical protein
LAAVAFGAALAAALVAAFGATLAFATGSGFFAGFVPGAALALATPAVTDVTAGFAGVAFETFFVAGIVFSS